MINFRIYRLPVFIFLVAGLLYSCDRPVKAPLSADSQAFFVGDAACASCHKDETKNWSVSHHASSMMHATDSTVLGDFNDFAFAESGKKSVFFKKGKDFMVWTEGEKGVNDTFRIEYTFGVKPLQQYLVKMDKGRYQALHLAWDTEQKKWFNLYEGSTFVPGDWMHWTRGSMNWNTMCAECHSTNLEKKYNPSKDSYNTTYSVINVSCESCHGAGSDHVDYYSNQKEGEAPTMKLTSGTFYADQVRACAPCHSRKSNISEKYTFEGDFFEDYITEVLADGRYHADGQILDEVYVYGSFIQSKMFANGVKCTDCHDAHTMTIKKEGNDLCLQCHDVSYTEPTHTHHEKGTPGASCIDCHMTGRYYMGVDFRRDHSFRIPRPDQSVKYGTPNACTECHKGQRDEWAARKVEEWFGGKRAYHFSDDLAPGRSRSPETVPGLARLLLDGSQPEIARATAAFYLADIPDRKAAEALMKALTDSSSMVRHYACLAFMNYPEQMKGAVLPLLKDSVRGVRIAAANVLTHVPLEQLPKEFQASFMTADKELFNSLWNRLDFPMGQFQMAQYYYRKGQIQESINYYEKSLEMDTLLHVSRENLARIYNGTGQNDKAMKHLRDILSYEPENVSALYSMGLIVAETGNLKMAASFLEKVIRLNPENERAWYNLGTLFIQEGNLEKALDTYQNGLKIHPESEDLKNGVEYVKQQMTRK